VWSISKKLCERHTLLWITHEQMTTRVASESRRALQTTRLGLVCTSIESRHIRLKLTQQPVMTDKRH
jgi:hypothetical protein